MAKTETTVARYVECTGEAHSNPYIDYCGGCMPYWGTYPECPIHNYKLMQSGKNGKGWCKHGRHYVTLKAD